MKQTAVDWLVGQLEKHYVSQDIKNTAVFMQAKEMEKEQIMEAHYAPKYGCFSEDYYNEAFNTNDN